MQMLVLFIRGSDEEDAVHPDWLARMSSSISMIFVLCRARTDIADRHVLEEFSKLVSSGCIHTEVSVISTAVSRTSSEMVVVLDILQSNAGTWLAPTTMANTTSV